MRLDILNRLGVHH